MFLQNNKYIYLYIDKMSYKKLNQININNDSFLSNIKFTNPNIHNKTINIKNSSCNIVSDKHYISYNTEYESTNICNNKSTICKDNIKNNKSCCC
jgi:hypothetical protein